MLLGEICVREYNGRPYILIIPELVDGLRIRFVLACVSEKETAGCNNMGEGNTV